jgi:hypothetical protein
MNNDWESMFPLVTIHKISREISDHNPIILDTLENREQKSRNFKFEKSWLKEDDFLDNVERIWRQPMYAKNSLEVVQIKLKRVKSCLKGWGANIRGRDKKKKQELHMELDILEDLEEKGCISNIQACRKSQIQIEVLMLLEKEEAFWQQRSRERWLLQGDNNTSFFHRIAN